MLRSAVKLLYLEHSHSWIGFSLTQHLNPNYNKNKFRMEVDAKIFPGRPVFQNHPGRHSESVTVRHGGPVRGWNIPWAFMTETECLQPVIDKQTKGIGEKPTNRNACGKAHMKKWEFRPAGEAERCNQEEREMGEQGVQSHPQPDSEVQGSLDCLRPCLKTNK